MYRIALVNMPFGGLHFPSLAITQLQAVVKKHLSGAVEADVFYLNHDFAQYFGYEEYQFMSDNGITTVTGLTDWLFREIAFPEAGDNTAAYLQRYKNSIKLSDEKLEELLHKRAGLNTLFDELIEKYQLDKYDLIGFTSMFDQSVASFGMARKIKQRNSNAIAVMGGSSCELSAGEVIAQQVDNIDFVFSGPALKSFVEFIQYILNGEPEKCHRIKGVYSRENAEWIKSNKHWGIGDETDINDRVQLDYRAFLASLQAKFPYLKPELFFETSRGCWWGEKSHCTFCGLNGITMNYRAMSPEVAIEQFKELFATYTDTSLFFAVDNILSRDYFDKVLPFIKVPENAAVFYETKLITNEAHMRILAEAGVTRIQPGIESLSTPVLKIMKKGTTAFQNIIFLKMSLKYNISPDWNLLIGFPRETEEVYKKYLEDIPNLVHLPPPGATFPVRFDRYSPYHMHQAEYELELKPLDFYSMVYPFPEEYLNEYAYFFADHNYDNRYLLHLARWRKKLEAAIEYWITRQTRSDGKLKPEVKLIDEKHLVYDSRSGEAKEYQLTPLAASILRLLNEPMGITTLKHKTKIDEACLREEVDRLKSYKLIFQEGESFLGLAC